jgi:DNA-binding MurR/RpiR family transcriptional regulator
MASLISAARSSERTAQSESGYGVTAERVERFLLENPLDVAFGTTRAIASRCQTSSATVVRASQRLGYEGFVELRDAVRRSLRK